MKSFSVPRRFWVVAVALAVMGSGFVYYFLYFVNSNQDFLIKEKFRVLTLISKNIIEKGKGFERVATQEYNRLYWEWETSPTPARGLNAIPKRPGLNPELIRYPNPYTEFYPLEDDEGTQYELGISVKDLIDTRPDQFQEFVVIRVDSIGTTARVAYQTLDSKIRIDSLEELMLSYHGFTAGNMLEVQIANESYKAFPHRLDFVLPGEVNEEWIIVGLVKSEFLDQKAMQVKPWILFYAMLVLVFMAMGMPLLKLKFMAPIERIHISNVVMTGVSLVAGTAVLVQIILSGYSFWQVQKNTDSNLKMLASKIKQEFKNEIESIGNLMDAADGYYTQIILTLKKDHHILPLALDSANSFSGTGILEKYPEFNSLIWLDKDGKQMLNITPKHRNTGERLPRLNEREYFGKVINKQFWILNEKDSIVIQSIRSWIDGSTEAALSKRSSSDSIRVLVTTTKLHSVMDPILPPGYGFCIVDEKGLTLFSSTDSNNMQEDFLAETNQNAELLAAMRGRASRAISVQYMGKEHRILIMPFYGLPLYVIAYRDTDFEKSPIILSAGLGFMAYLTLFGILAVQLFVLFIASYQSTKLKIRRFYLSWLRPHSDNESLNTYKRIILFNTCVLIELIVFLLVLSWGNIGTPQKVMAIFCLSAPNLFLAIYAELKKDGELSGRMKFIYVSIAGIVLTNIVLETSLLNWVFQLLFWAIYFVIFPSRWPVKARFFALLPIDRLVERIPIHKPLKAFSIMLFSWLTIISIIPPLYLNEVGRKIESEIWEKYNQLEVAQAIEARNKRIDMDYAYIPDEYRLNKKENGKYYEFTGMTRWAETSSSFRDFMSLRDSAEGEKESLSVYGSGDSQLYPRPSLDSIIDKTQESSFGNAADSAWLWHTTNDSLNFLYSVPGEKDIALASVIKPSEFNQWTNIDLWVLWGELLLLALGLYHIIHFAVRRIFAFDLVDHPSPVLLEPKNLYDVEKTCGIFIVGLPFSGKKKLLYGYQQFLKEKQIDSLMWSFNEVNQPASNQQLVESKQAVILMQDFQFSLNNHVTAQHKLELLEKMLQYPDRQIIISSDTKPESIIDFYEAMIKRTYDHRYEPEFKKEYEEYFMAKKRWKHVLGSFVTLYQPLASLSSEHEKQDDGLMAHPKIANELNHGTYLRRLLPMVTDFYNRMVHPTDPAHALTREEEEDLILMIQSHSETYYQSIWTSLTTEEKFVLYDLAKDRLVNAQNFKVLKGLIELGLITTGQSLKMMNKSFNNFILSVVTIEEERKIDSYLRSAGNWSTIQIVLIIGMIGLVAFIALGQKEFLNNINGFLAALAGIFGLLLRLMGMVASPGSK